MVSEDCSVRRVTVEFPLTGQALAPLRRSASAGPNLGRLTGRSLPTPADAIGVAAARRRERRRAASGRTGRWRAPAASWRCARRGRPADPIRAPPSARRLSPASGRRSRSGGRVVGQEQLPVGGRLVERQRPEAVHRRAARPAASAVVALAVELRPPSGSTARSAIASAGGSAPGSAERDLGPVEVILAEVADVGLRIDPAAEHRRLRRLRGQHRALVDAGLAISASSASAKRARSKPPLRPELQRRDAVEEVVVGRRRRVLVDQLLDGEEVVVPGGVAGDGRRPAAAALAGLGVDLQSVLQRPGGGQVGSPSTRCVRARAQTQVPRAWIIVGMRPACAASARM